MTEKTIADVSGIKIHMIHAEFTIHKTNADQLSDSCFLNWLLTTINWETNTHSLAGHSK